MADAPSAAELAARLQALTAPPTPDAQAPPDQAALAARLRAATAANPLGSIDAGDVGMSVASAIPRALTALLGMPVDTLNALSRNVPQGAIPFFPTFGRPNIPPQQTLSSQITGEPRAVPPLQIPYGGAADFQNLARSYEASRPAAGGGVPIPGSQPAPSLFDYRPTSNLGRFAQTGTEWAVPALLGGPGSLARRVVTGEAGGIASEGMHDLVNRVVPEAYRPYVAPILDTAAGLLTMGMANRPYMARTNPSAVVRDATRDMTPADWQVAEQRMQAAPPGTLLPVEALGTPGATLQGIASDVAASPAGGSIVQAIQTRSPRVVAAGEQAIANVGGPPRAAADVVRDVSEGARDTIGEAVAARTRASQPYYSAADVEQVPIAAFNPIIRDINARIARVGEDSEIGRALVDLRDRIIRPSTGTTVPIGPLSTLAQETTAGLYPRPPGQSATVVPPRAMSAREQGVVGPVVQDLQDTLERLSPNYRTAQDLHRANSPRVNALEQPDVMGNLQAPITPTTRIPTALADQVAMLTGDNVTPQQINRVFGELSMSSRPQAASDLGAVLLRNELNEAARRMASAPNAPSTGIRFETALNRTPDAAGRIEAIVRGMARANGQNPDTAWTGFSRLLDTFAQHGNIPAIGSRTAPRGQLAQALGGNWISTLLNLPNLGQGSILASGARSMAERVAAGDYAALARAFTDPRGVQILRDMAGQIPNSPRAQQNLTRFLELARQAGQTMQDQRTQDQR